LKRGSRGFPVAEKMRGRDYHVLEGAELFWYYIVKSALLVGKQLFTQQETVLSVGYCSMAVQTENQTTNASVNGDLKEDPNGVEPRIVRALDDEGGTTNAKVCRPLQLPSHSTISIYRRWTKQPR
jgi:hypothetical protein